MRISLIAKDLVDRFVAGFRSDKDITALGLPKEFDEVPEGVKDWGLVSFEGIEYYMASYQPPFVEEQEDAA